ncbi:cupredoxin domain-containing protein [Vineibacter terrae]|nr:cupredoxin domain-containing protein [Vineibacter terrae]
MSIESRRGLLRLMPAAGLTAALGAAGAARAADPPSFVLVIKNHQFQPGELEIPANTKVKLVIRNQDPTPEEFESVSLRRERVIPGGAEGVIYIGPLSPGRYDMFGDFNPKTARGFIVVK